MAWNMVNSLIMYYHVGPKNSSSVSFVFKCNTWNMAILCNQAISSLYGTLCHCPKPLISCEWNKSYSEWDINQEVAHITRLRWSLALRVCLTFMSSRPLERWGIHPNVWNWTSVSHLQRGRAFWDGVTLVSTGPFCTHLIIKTADFHTRAQARAFKTVVGQVL